MNGVIEKLHPADLTDLADLVAELVMQKLGGPVVSSVLPPWFAEILRRGAHGNQWRSNYVLPLGMGNGVRADFTIDPDGTLRLELMDLNGTTAWRGAFRADDAGDRT